MSDNIADIGYVRAMRVHDLTGPDDMRLDQVAPQSPTANEVRVRVYAAAVNFPDLLMTKGEYQFKPEPPFSPGLEVSGEVLECGPDVEGYAPGDRVIARTLTLFPGFIEEVVIPEDYLFHIPDAMDYDSAAALFITYHTSYNALIEKAQLQKGETLVVHGAAGGVGLAAVQIGLAVGARVIATAGSDEKAEFLKREGVHEVINYSTEDIRTRIKELTDGVGCDVVLDPVGGAAFKASVRSLAPGGRLLVVGFTSGGIETVPANIILIKEISVIGIRAGEHCKRHPNAMHKAVSQLLEWYREGKIAPRIAKSFPLERTADAVKALQDRSVVGKVIVEMQ
ncbi:NADPH:quinone oxidoreductase family protein [Ruegeria hyattellae]|uniref:NADPH:quinone oxidoreductase family protein n=1 Tax=Ruegeria hyattellae TaxID=3233337 RepID=UPI00355B8B6A